MRGGGDTDGWIRRFLFCFQQTKLHMRGSSQVLSAKNITPLCRYFLDTCSSLGSDSFFKLTGYVRQRENL